MNASDRRQLRRDFLTTLGASAAGLAVGACGKCTTTGSGYKGTASNAAQTAAVMPAHVPLVFLEPDVPGEGPIPNVYLTYPKQTFVRVFKSKPTTGGPPIKTISSVWSPVPPGLGRNSFLQAVNSELGITVKEDCLAPLTFASHAYPEFHLLMPLYICRRWQGTVAPHEGQALKWVRPGKLRELAMPPADEPLIPALIDLLGA